MYNQLPSIAEMKYSLNDVPSLVSGSLPNILADLVKKTQKGDRLTFFVQPPRLDSQGAIDYRAPFEIIAQMLNDMGRSARVEERA